MEGRIVEGLGEGVRLGFRNADFSGIFEGRGLSTSGEVGLLVGVLVVSGKLASPFCCVGGIFLNTGSSGPRGGRLFGLAGFGRGV